MVSRNDDPLKRQIALEVDAIRRSEEAAKSNVALKYAIGRETRSA